MCIIFRLNPNSVLQLETSILHYLQYLVFQAQHRVSATSGDKVSLKTGKTTRRKCVSARAMSDRLERWPVGTIESRHCSKKIPVMDEFLRVVVYSVQYSYRKSQLYLYIKSYTSKTSSRVESRSVVAIEIKRIDSIHKTRAAARLWKPINDCTVE